MVCCNVYKLAGKAIQLQTHVIRARWSFNLYFEPLHKPSNTAYRSTPQSDCGLPNELKLMAQNCTLIDQGEGDNDHC